MSTSKRALFALLLSGLVLSGCDDKPKQAKTEQKTNTATVAAADTSRLAQWGAEQADRLADDLTAQVVYLLLDGSGSMNDGACQGSGSKMRQAEQAILAFAGTLNRNTQLGMALFVDGRVREVLPIGGGNQADRIRSAIGSGIRANGGTPLGQAIAFSRDKLKQQADRQQGYGQYLLVPVTDGAATDPEVLDQEVETTLHDTPISLATIGFCIGADHSLNKPGRTLYQEAGNATGIANALTSFVAEADTFRN